MGRALRWTLLFCAALVLTAIFEPPLMATFASWGWHDAPGRIAENVVNWLAGLVGEAAFPWVSAGVLGGAGGAWAHYLAQVFDRSRPTREQRFQACAPDLLRMAHAVESMKGSWRYYSTPHDQRGQWDAGTGGRYMALEIKLKELGIRLPSSLLVSLPADYDARAGSLSDLLRVLHHLAADGHYREAKEMADRETPLFEAKFPDPNLAQTQQQEGRRKLPPR